MTTISGLKLSYIAFKQVLKAENLKGVIIIRRRTPILFYQNLEPMKVHNLFFLSAIFLALLTTSCNRAYLVNDFEATTFKHKEIAVLPFEVIFTGKKPERLSFDELEAILEVESEIFQNNYYNQILRSSTRNSRQALGVNVQAHSTTAGILEENGITARNSWKMKPAELAEILGVDAVVRGRVEQNRLMSDAASFGIDLGTQILTSMGGLPVNIGNGVINNKRIRAAYQLVNAEDERLLWSTSYICEADWTRSADEVVENINRRSANRFPYRVGAN